VRDAMANDLDAPAALAAIDDWVDAALARATDSATSPLEAAAPGLVALLTDSLLGVSL